MATETYSLDQFTARRDLAPPPDDGVHAMYNPTERDTVEIHVYGRDLHGLPRKTWAADGRVTPPVSPKYLNC